MDIYELLVNDEIINHNVLETNRYTKKIIASNPPTKNSRLYKWSDTNDEGIKNFLGLVLWMGLVRLAKHKSYWEKHGLCMQCILSLSMSQNYFQALLSMIYWAGLKSCYTFFFRKYMNN